jgi:hypothetical protein
VMCLWALQSTSQALARRVSHLNILIWLNQAPRLDVLIKRH